MGMVGRLPGSWRPAIAPARPEEIADLGLAAAPSVVPRRAGPPRRRHADRLRGRRGAGRARRGARRRPRATDRCTTRSDRLGVVATSATGTVTARLARGPRRALLDVPPRTALLVELRLLFDQHGRPFERTETRYVADRYVIDVVHAHP